MSVGTSAIARLQDVAVRAGAITTADERAAAAELNVPLAAVHGAATFYDDLALTRRGDRHVRVCEGTACFAADGGRHVVEVERSLGVSAGSCREDGSVVERPAVPGLRIPEMFDGAIDGRVRALYVMGEDIAQTDPDSAHVRAALAACDLVVVQEIFLSKIALLADVVLPAASFLEKDGTFVNFDRRFQRVRPALPPPGQARTDFDILNAVAAGLGADLRCPDPAAALADCAAVAPLFAGVTHRRLEDEGALHWPCRSPSSWTYIRPTPLGWTFEMVLGSS